MFKIIDEAARERVVQLVCAGACVREAGVTCGVSYRTARRVWRQRGHVELVTRGGNQGGLGPGVGGSGGAGDLTVRRRRPLTGADRARIGVGLVLGVSPAAIAVMLGRARSVVTREIARNTSPDGRYRGEVAERVAAQRRRRPKPFKLAQDPRLCTAITAWMDQGWSPGLIARVLAADHGAGNTARVSHETIYRALYVQARGGLRADLYRQLSLGRGHRKSRTGDRNHSPYRAAFTISQRPAEVEDRAVPGHWEGDLILGAGGRSAIGTLVERSTRFVILLHLPARHDAASVAEAMIREMSTLPAHLRRSITWDRGTELADYARLQLHLDTTLYFCDPHSPWQRGTNENTNRLLRHWFAKGSDLSTHSAEDLARVAATLNARPRPTLNLETPAHRLNNLLQTAA